MGKKLNQELEPSQKSPFWLVGIDEAGRGPIAGPVSVGLVAFPVNDETLTQTLTHILGGEVKDSKQLTAKKREAIYEELVKLAKTGEIKISSALISSKVIDQEGIVAAIKQGIKINLQKLALKPEEVKILLDGSLFAPAEYLNQTTIIRGDATELVIALASVVAKVDRDQLMEKEHLNYPNYGFDQHKGYGTKLHYQKIKEFGLSDLHRRSFLKKFKP